MFCPTPTPFSENQIHGQDSQPLLRQSFLFRGEAISSYPRAAMRAGTWSTDGVKGCGYHADSSPSTDSWVPAISPYVDFFLRVRCSASDYNVGRIPKPAHGVTLSILSEGSSVNRYRAPTMVS